MDGLTPQIARLALSTPTRIPKSLRITPRSTRRAREPPPNRWFTIFNALPKSIRKQIWTLALPGPCVIIIKDQEYLEDNKLYIRRPTAQYKVPVLLHCNQESRRVAEKHFTRAFDSLLSGIPIYINFETDLLFFHSPWALLQMGGFLKPSDHNQVCQLYECVKYIGVGNLNILLNTTSYVLQRFTAMNTLIVKDIVARDETEVAKFYGPLTHERGGPYEAVEYDTLGNVAEARAGLVGNRRYGPVQVSKIGMGPALLIIQSSAALGIIAKDWAKDFGMNMSEARWKKWYAKNLGET